MMLDTAIYWHVQGVSVIPTAWRSKKPLVKWGQYKDNPPSLEKLIEWFYGARCNMALITTENLIVLDFDNPAEYTNWLYYQMDVNSDLINTYIVATSRGLHLYYWIDEPFDKININAYTIEALNLISKGKSIRGLKTPKVCTPYEIKSHGQLVTIPPSVHRSGVAYKAINSPDKIKKVSSIQQLLTFSCVEFERPKPEPIKTNIWDIQPTITNTTGDGFERVDLLGLFPEAKASDETGRYWLTDCPLHGNKDNFWLDTEGDLCGCYAGCGNFLATEIKRIICQ